MQEVNYIPHLIDEENEAQKRQVDLAWTLYQGYGGLPYETQNEVC